MEIAVIAALCSLLSAAIASVVVYMLGHRAAKVEPKRVEADATRLFAEAYSTLVDDLGERNKGLKLRVDELEAELELRIAETAELTRRISGLERENLELKEQNRRLKESLDNGGL